MSRPTQTGDVPPTTIEDSRDTVILDRSPKLMSCFDALRGLPTYIIPRRKVLGEVQRLGALADALTQSGLHEKAGAVTRFAELYSLTERLATLRSHGR